MCVSSFNKFDHICILTITPALLKMVQMSLKRKAAKRDEGIMHSVQDVLHMRRAGLHADLVLGMSMGQREGSRRCERVCEFSVEAEPLDRGT